MINMVERNVFSIYFIIVPFLGFVLAFKYTTNKDWNEDEDDLAPIATSLEFDPTTKLSCISCDNVRWDECNDPKNKLVPLVVCENYDDVCYSMHTPFGVIDRGCYSPNRNVTTYVCSCNLCNNLPIKLLPMKFTTVQDWLENVIDMTRGRALRKSILKTISCIQCEAKTLYDTEYSRANGNCYNGNITVWPTQECTENEICGIKYVRNKGYIWRGCIERPLYNYWWSFCSENLCNYEVIGSLYKSLKQLN